MLDFSNSPLFNHGMPANATLGRNSVFLLLSLSSAAIVAAAGPSLEATGSGFYGLSEVSGPFGRTNLSPITTVDPPTGGLKVALNANANHIQSLDASHSFQFAATLAGQGHTAYGAFSGSFSFLLQAKPKSVTTQFSTIDNRGHSELFSHMKLTFNDSGIVTSHIAGGHPCNGAVYRRNSRRRLCQSTGRPT
jgi:hypothetical protein